MKKEQDKTDKEFQAELRKAERLPYSQYAIWFFKLKYLQLSINGMLIDKFEAWFAGYKDAEMILAGKTPIEFSKKS
jgi:hypothetical protein